MVSPYVLVYIKGKRTKNKSPDRTFHVLNDRTIDGRANVSWAYGEKLRFNHIHMEISVAEVFVAHFSETQ